jgi:hypothetical protein
MEAKPQLSSLKVGSWLFYAKIFMGLVLKVGSSFLLDTSPEPHLQKVLSCWHPCHTWSLGLGAPVWSGKSQLPCSQQLILHQLTSNYLGLGTWDLGPMWTGPTSTLEILATCTAFGSLIPRWNQERSTINEITDNPHVIHNPHNQT